MSDGPEERERARERARERERERERARETVWRWVRGLASAWEVIGCLCVCCLVSAATITTVGSRGCERVCGVKAGVHQWWVGWWSSVCTSVCASVRTPGHAEGRLADTGAPTRKGKDRKFKEE